MCIGVGSDKFLGFLVSQRGIEVNLDKIKAIEDISDQLTSVNEVQRFTVKVSEFDIEYKPRTAIKSQVLAKFMADSSPGLMPLAAKEAVSDIKTVPLTNNEAEYEALVAGLELARGLGSEVIEIKEWSIVHISREENMEVDALSNLGSSIEIKVANSGMVVQLLYSVLDVDGYCEVNSTNLIWDKWNEFIEYLRHGKLLEDPKSSRALWTKVARYCRVDEQLYRRSFQEPLAQCLGASEVDYVMREVHRGLEK
uniref:Uncharacterized protein LOC104240336 n=1 Tax=Nicotiana sylvestris TaxID=4096 RepID=A0A1U7XN47_NICSY|nr:PREDICTED: uncharacterized protein LOC104240336 [Nicotiana sylvestris]